MFEIGPTVHGIAANVGRVCGTCKELEGAIMFEVVVRRVKGAEWVVISTPDLATAVAKRAALVAGYHERGFVGGRNAAGVYLSKRVNGKRVRLAISVRMAVGAFSVN